MRQAALGNVADVNWGDTSITKASYVDEGFPAYSATGNDGFLPYYDFDREAIVLSAIGARCGKTWFATGKWSVIKNTIRIWSTSPDLYDRYLYWLTADPNFWPRRGAAQPFITIGDARKLNIPPPPLPEQRRIAAILDQADALRAKRREALAKLDEMAQAIFVEMFGDPASGIHKYPAQNLAEVSELINGDRSSNYPSGDDLVEYGVPFLSTKNIRGAKFDLSNCNFITEQKLKSLSRGKLQRHDLVITLRGTLGLCAEFDCEFETGFINAQMMIIRPRTELLPGYVREFISNPHTQAKLQRGSSGSAIPQLTAKQVGELSIPVPPLDIQCLFIQSLSHLAGVVNQFRESAQNTENLFTSLQHRAFSGTL